LPRAIVKCPFTIIVKKRIACREMVKRSGFLSVIRRTEEGQQQAVKRRQAMSAILPLAG
jgi:hypothetical protein